MNNILLIMILCTIKLNCYSSETLQISINQCNMEKPVTCNNNSFIVCQSEPEIMPS